MRHETRVTIDAPVEAVWDTLAAVGHWPDWTPTVTTVRRLDSDPLREGSRTEMIQPGQPKRVWTVTRLSVGTSFCWESGGALLKMTADHQLSANAGATEVLLSFELSGPLGPLAGALSGKKIREFVATEGKSLKEWCER